jgi:hypothetical protein
MHLRGRTRPLQAKRVKFSHDRVTVKRLRNADCGMRIEKSKIQNRKSEIDQVGKPVADVIAGKMFRAKTSQADMVTFIMPCFSFRFGEENRAF